MIHQVKPIWYLLIGIFLLSATHLTCGIGLMAWIAAVPFLVYLRTTQGITSRLLFVLALIIAWSIAIAKIVSPPMPYAMVFLFSIPIGLVQLPGYLLWDRFKHHPWSPLLFPATMVVMEWLQYTFTPFASWGAAAYTQSNNLPLMQSVSIFGMPGLSFLIYWINVSIAAMVVNRKATWSTLRIPVSVLLMVILLGTIRSDFSKLKGVDSITVAAVGTDSKIGGLPLPSKESNDQVQSGLFDRTTLAARNGAKLVVWNEAATYVLPEEETAWRDTLQALAATLNTAIVAGYVIPLPQTPFQYENKYLFIDSSGTVVASYHKHQPVPGEPAVKGEEALQVFDIAGANVGGAICYDYDFPYLAQGFGKLGADIVAVPSSDWRGIDPIHTRMAAFRAVEQGHSILRSTRFGLSAAITPYGEMAAQMSSFDHNDKIMMAHLPVKGVVTVYAVVGDVFVYLCIGYMVLFLIYYFKRKR